jgi:hypothetical protein
LLALDSIILKLKIAQHSKMGPALVTYGDSDQTEPFIASRQCVEAAGMRAGASDNGKRMIVGGIG